MQGFLALAAVLPRYGAMKNSGAVIYAALLVLLLCFIWGQSILPRSVSAKESSYVMNVLKPIFDPLDRVDDAVFHHYLRKAAHFSEYAALGICAYGFLLRIGQMRRRVFPLPDAAAFCITVAAIDECIQMFSDGRGAQLRDVLLDFCGALFGMAVFALAAALFGKKQRS